MVYVIMHLALEADFQTTAAVLHRCLKFRKYSERYFEQNDRPVVVSAYSLNKNGLSISVYRGILQK